MEGTAWYFLAAYSKMPEERDTLKKELQSEKQTQDLDNSRSSHTQTMRTCARQRTPRVWLDSGMQKRLGV